jgi:hypothetical protein
MRRELALSHRTRTLAVRENELLKETFCSAYRAPTPYSIAQLNLPTHLMLFYINSRKSGFILTQHFVST